ncbi:MAG: hypothetical protein ABL999_02755 [Pyrinomonadaceae bacterium]
MNVFEDLIVELKQENLLEKTVIDNQRFAEQDTGYLEETEVPNAEYESPSMPIEPAGSSTDEQDLKVELEGYDAHLHDTAVPDVEVVETQVHKKPRNGQEFYRKRAMSEVSNLQMVEHVLTGVEREYMKIKPRIFDDFAAKKALHTFLQVTENENSTEHKEAEFTLMSETEAWCTALSERDHDIAVSNLRQYCENSRPPLSSQALVALARFYRNLPYSEAVRSKFDFVITRLFSRPTENEMRTEFFTRDETIAHILTLYRDWSSIAFYGDDEDGSKILLAALSFDDLAVEAENAGSFDQLIEKDFFGRVRGFKDGIGEMFYAPNVLAAAIDANIRIGNAYVKLIDLERHKMDAESIQTKYGDKHDLSVSEGVGRTLELVELLRSPLNKSVKAEEKTDEGEQEEVREFRKEETSPAEPAPARNLPPFVNSLIEQIRSMNRFVAVSSVVLIALSIGIYVYANFFATEKGVTAEVRVVGIEDPLYREYVESARVSNATLYGLLLPTWENLSKEKKQEILQKMYQDGKDKGYSQVNLINKDGKPAGFASATRLDIIGP